MFNKKNILSVDAETNGLLGQPFQIAATLISPEGEELATFNGRCPIEGPTNEWVAQNVLPLLEGMAETHESEAALLADFAKWYMNHRQGAEVICHVPYPVETAIFRRLIQESHIGMWDGPFPLYDLASALRAKGFDNPTSDSAAAAHYGVAVPEDGSSHDALYDARLAALIWVKIMS